MLYVLIKIFSHASVKRKTKKAAGFEILHFYPSFSSDTVTVKGLKIQVLLLVTIS